MSKFFHLKLFLCWKQTLFESPLFLIFVFSEQHPPPHRGMRLESWDASLLSLSFPSPPRWKREKVGKRVRGITIGGLHLLSTGWKGPSGGFVIKNLKLSPHFLLILIPKWFSFSLSLGGPCGGRLSRARRKSQLSVLREEHQTSLSAYKLWLNDFMRNAPGGSQTFSGSSNVCPIKLKVRGDHKRRIFRVLFLGKCKKRPEIRNKELKEEETEFWISCPHSGETVTTPGEEEEKGGHNSGQEEPQRNEKVLGLNSTTLVFITPTVVSEFMRRKPQLTFPPSVGNSPMGNRRQVWEVAHIFPFPIPNGSQWISPSD